MKRKINMLKRLFLTISSSCAINWLIFFILLVIVIFNLLTIGVYKAICILLCMELLFVNVNNNNFRY